MPSISNSPPVVSSRTDHRDTLEGAIARPSGSATIDCTTDIVDASFLLARAFVAGRRLTIDAPTCPDHAHHVAVEFIHPVIAGTRSLPATVGSVSSENDCLLVIGDRDDARQRDAGLFIPADASDADIMLTYHLLWELVQVCLEHPGLVGAEPAGASDSTGFLYPFLDAAEHDETGLRTSLGSSASAKSDVSRKLASDSLTSNANEIDAAADTVRTALANGGRVITMGNGGSSTDAARIVRLLAASGVDAMSLSTDYAVISALANDLGADRVFARQLDAIGRPGDVLIGCSTSGTSRNLLAAFDRSASLGVVGIGVSGYDGGDFVHQGGVQHCLKVGSTSVHRIQEAQTSLIAALCAQVDGGSVAA